jgi:two-component system chemotaxis sensor kinase CheA
MSNVKDRKMFLNLLDEIEDTLREFEAQCLRLERDQSGETLKACFRLAHNLKGAAFIFGLTKFGEVVHLLEDLLGLWQSSGAVVDGESVLCFLKTHEFLTEWVAALRLDEKAEPNTNPAKALISRDTTRVREMPLEKRKAVEAQQAPKVLTIAEMKAMKAAQTGSTPSPTVTAAPTAAAPVSPASGTAASAGLSTGPNSQVAPSVKPDASVAKESSEGLEAAQALEPVVPEADREGSRSSQSLTGPGHKKRASGNGQQGRSGIRASGTLRISASRVDEIMQLIGELSIHQSILWHGQLTDSLNSAICRNAITLNQKALKDLQSLILTLRMQPIETLFQRAERTAKEMARELSKSIDISLIGSEVLLDKTVIELMTDPLNHMIRNAIDHGIEAADERNLNGKPERARVTLAAAQDAGQVIITITDDGKGIDASMVFEKAVKKGLVSAGAKMSETEMLNLIFLPGFSTREQASQFSGRGVGMDVVQKAILQLGGSVEIRTKVGKGTSFRITLPTSLEIIDGMVVIVGGDQYIAPMQDVIEIVDLETFQIEPFGDGGRAIRLRDVIVPIERLADFFPGAMRGRGGGRDATENVALIVRLSDGGRLALCVEKVVSQQQIVVRPLSQHLANIPGFAGVTILGSGEPGMIMSLNHVADSYMKWTGVLEVGA